MENKMKNINLNDGIPKICISVVEKNERDIIKYIKEVSKLPIDIIEWRADFFINDSNFNDIVTFLN